LVFWKTGRRRGGCLQEMVATGGSTVLSNDLWKFCSGMTNYEGKRRPNAVYANIAYNMHQTLPTALTIIRNKRSSTIANSCIGRGNVPIDTGVVE